MKIKSPGLGLPVPCEAQPPEDTRAWLDPRKMPYLTTGFSSSHVRCPSQQCTGNQRYLIQSGNVPYDPKINIALCPHEIAGNKERVHKLAGIDLLICCSTITVSASVSRPSNSVSGFTLVLQSPSIEQRDTLWHSLDLTNVSVFSRLSHNEPAECMR